MHQKQDNVNFCGSPPSPHHPARLGGLVGWGNVVRVVCGYACVRVCVCVMSSRMFCGVTLTSRVVWCLVFASVAQNWGARAGSGWRSLYSWVRKDMGRRKMGRIYGWMDGRFDGIAMERIIRGTRYCSLAVFIHQFG